VRAAILQTPDAAWVSALDQDGTPRPNGQVAEITEQLDLAGWPEGSRVIVRRERPHPGAQLSFTDHDGYRFQAILTDQADPNIAVIERRHRARARVEDHVRNDKDTGLRNLPFRDLEDNRVWLQLVLIAHDLIWWMKRLLLTTELARVEPKRLRYRLLHVAARLAFHARTATLRLQATWPWATELAAAFARLKAPRPSRLTRRTDPLDNHTLPGASAPPSMPDNNRPDARARPRPCPRRPQPTPTRPPPSAALTTHRNNTHITPPRERSGLGIRRGWF
jgi:hypothetical protein